MLDWTPRDDTIYIIRVEGVQLLNQYILIKLNCAILYRDAILQTRQFSKEVHELGWGTRIETKMTANNAG